MNLTSLKEKKLHVIFHIKNTNMLAKGDIGYFGKHQLWNQFLKLSIPLDKHEF